MSRYCDECSEDGSCLRQKLGTVSCGDGSKKSQDRIIRDMNDSVVILSLNLAVLKDQYLMLGNPKKAKSMTKIIGLIKQEYQEDIANRNNRMQQRALRVACGSEEE